jgi:hypothetical protein
MKSFLIGRDLPVDEREVRVHRFELCLHPGSMFLEHRQSLRILPWARAASSAYRRLSLIGMPVARRRPRTWIWKKGAFAVAAVARIRSANIADQSGPLAIPQRVSTDAARLCGLGDRHARLDAHQIEHRT